MSQTATDCKSNGEALKQQVREVFVKCANSAVCEKFIKGYEALKEGPQKEDLKQDLFKMCDDLAKAYEAHKDKKDVTQNILNFFRALWPILAPWYKELKEQISSDPNKKLGSEIWVRFALLNKIASYVKGEGELYNPNMWMVYELGLLAPTPGDPETRPIHVMKSPSSSAAPKTKPSSVTSIDLSRPKSPSPKASKSKT